MTFREMLRSLDARGALSRRAGRLSRDLEAAAAIASAADSPVLLEDVEGLPVAANLLSSRDLVSEALGGRKDLAEALESALSSPAAPRDMERAPACREEAFESPDLSRIPILRHFAEEGGRYVTAGVMIVRDPDLGPNAAFHRLMYAGPRRFTARLVEGRGTDTAWRKASGPIPAAVCIGAPAQVLVAAAAPAPMDVDELAVANAISPLRTAKCLTSDLVVPADSEYVMEGRLLRETAAEGPFVDITRMLDPRRMQPVFEVDAITSRSGPVYHSIYPGGAEHRTLMGLPRELAVLAAASKAADAADFRLSAGGSGWLQGVLSIRKRSAADAGAAAEAALSAHPSMKILVVVDDDIDPSDDLQVAWAVATRMQPARDARIIADAPSSSLDPSADFSKGPARGSKLVLDATAKTGPGKSAGRFKRIY